MEPWLRGLTTLPEGVGLALVLWKWQAGKVKWIGDSSRPVVRVVAVVIEIVVCLRIVKYVLGRSLDNGCKERSLLRGFSFN